MTRTNRFFILLACVAFFFSAATIIGSASHPPPFQTHTEEEPGDDTAGPLIDIPIDGDCMAACCEGAGGDVVEESDGQLQCHVDDDDPYLPVKVEIFQGCSEGC